MPFLLKVIEDISEFEQFKSVLIVPCRFCPAASSAVKENKPYIELFRKFMKTDSYEQSINTLRSKFEERGIRTGIFKSKLIHQFVLCMWTSKRRKKLRDRTKEYEALIILGCEGAVQTVRDSLTSSSCKIFQGLETEGLMSIKPKFQLPCNISLELESVTPVLLQKNESKEDEPSALLFREVYPVKQSDSEAI
jgi:hypothetical protein